MKVSASQPSPLLVALAGAASIAVAMGIGRFAYTPLLPGMQDALGWSVAEAGDVASANFFGYMLGAMLASTVVHRPRRYQALFAGFFFSALTTFAGGFITHYGLWLGLRLVSGVASAYCLVIASAIVIEVTTRCRRPQLGSLYFAGVSAGIVGSVLLIELARLQGLSVFVQWRLLGLFSFVAMVFAWWVFRSLQGEKIVHVKIETENEGSPQALKCLIIAYGLFGFGYVVTATFIVAIARNFANAALLEPAAWIVVGLVGAPSVFLWQHFSKSIGLVAVLRITFVLEAIGVLIAGFATTPSAVLLGAALLGGTFVAITALGMIAARQMAGLHQDKAMAWMTVSFGLGQFLGPGVAGRMADASGSFASSSTLAAILLIIGACLLRSGSLTKT